MGGEGKKTEAVGTWTKVWGIRRGVSDFSFFERNKKE